ncbi:uncharacterized protein UTRI_05268 [Ustilago trichophora]|uniref:Uncharacterized protein n=1 Tax=Ustilago trichophora TaxID=86804 RepID=A0A5C3EMC7_9BASI|nr:uncharacterized protein UTRI_05268 [Ustilago trichophora]
MDSSNPYQSSPSLSQSDSVTFDPNAVMPAFARTPSHHLATAPPTEPSSSSTNNMNAGASQPRLSIPSLGDSSLMGELPTTDPLSILLQKHLPPHLRPVRDLTGAWHTPSSLTHFAPTNEIPDPFTSPYTNQHSPSQAITSETVRQAASTNAWRKIASLARSQLERYSLTERNRLYSSHQASQQPVSLPRESDEGETMDVEEVLQWWSVRLYALARLRLYSMLRTEMGGLWQILASTRVEEEEEEVIMEDSEMVPFTLRVLRATEPKFRGDTRTTIEQYTVLIHMCKGHIKRLKARAAKNVDVRAREQIKVWKERAVRVGMMLAFTLAEAKDYSGAIELLEPLVEKALTRGSDKEKEDAEGLEARVQLVVVASRIWIQAGDLSTARTLLDRASSLLTTTSPHITHSQTLLSAIQGDFSTSSIPNPNPNPNSSIAEQLNTAIQTFYTAHLDDSILALEIVLDNTPAQIAAADAVLFNIATLYELAAGGEREVVERKRGLLEKTAKWTGEPGASGSWFKL